MQTFTFWAKLYDTRYKFTIDAPDEESGGKIVSAWVQQVWKEAGKNTLIIYPLLKNHPTIKCEIDN